MSLLDIRQALETALATITPNPQTAYENMPFVPTPGIGFQQAFLLPAQPQNIEIGPGYFDVGIFQVNLFWPKDAGAAAVLQQAALIRAKFPQSASFVSGAATVNITATPQIGPAVPDGDRYMVPVKINWSCRVPQ